VRRRLHGACGESLLLHARLRRPRGSTAASCTRRWGDERRPAGNGARKRRCRGSRRRPGSAAACVDDHCRHMWGRTTRPQRWRSNRPPRCCSTTVDPLAPPQCVTATARVARC
jgi:hypothetical protein